MTTNKPEVKRYDCTSGGAQYCYGCYTMKEVELGDYVEWEAYEALQTECESLRKDAEIGRSVREKAYLGASYGCHCDLEEGMQPDGCVIDSDERYQCIYATHIEVKEQCEYWKIIATDNGTVEKSK